MKSASASRVARLGAMQALRAHEVIERGIDSVAVFEAAKTYGIVGRELAGLIGAHARTVQRWAGKNIVLDPVTGGRFYKLSTILAKATELFGSTGDAMAWLRAEQRALEYRKPIDLMRTEAGGSAVENLLGRIEYGVVT